MNQKIFNKGRLALAITGLLGAGLMSGCSDSGGGGGDSATSTYLPYYTADGSYFFADPAAPGTPIAIKHADTSAVNVFTDYQAFSIGATVNVGSDREGDAHFADTVIVSNNAFHKVNMTTASGAPALTQISSADLTGVSVCDQEVFTVPGNSAANIFFYVTEGTDAICDTNDDVAKYVTLSDSATTAPVDAPYGIPEDAIYDSTGNLSGWLLKNSNNLVIASKDFASVGTALNTTTTVDSVDIVNLDDSGVMTLIVYYAGGTGNGTIAQLDTVNNTLTDILTLGNASHNADKSDGSDYYFHTRGDGSTVGDAIYKLASDGSASSATKLVETAIGNDLGKLRITSNHVMYLRGGNIYKQSTTAATACGTATGLTDCTLLVDGSTNAVKTLFVSGAWVYYNTTSGATDVAGYIKEDGTGAGAHTGYSDFGASWVGRSRGLFAAVGANRTVETMVLSAYDVDLTAQTAGWKLTAYNASNNSAGVTLGMLETTDSVASTFSGNGSRVLVEVNNGNGIDIYYLDTAKASSLTQVTNTNADDENAINI